MNACEMYLGTQAYLLVLKNYKGKTYRRLKMLMGSLGLEGDLIDALFEYINGCTPEFVISMFAKGKKCRGSGWESTSESLYFNDVEVCNYRNDIFTMKMNVPMVEAIIYAKQ